MSRRPGLLKRQGRYARSAVERIGLTGLLAQGLFLLSRRLPVQGDARWPKDNFVQITKAFISLPTVPLKADAAAPSKFLGDGMHPPGICMRHTTCGPMNLSGGRGANASN